MIRLPIIFGLAVLLAVLGGAAVQVQAQTTPTPNEINAVARELWCPLCNGVRLDNCELQACDQMRGVIAQKLTAGESKDNIKAYFVEQYGDVVLGAPSAEGFNSLVWWLPVLAGLVGLGWVVYFVLVWTRRRPAAVRAAGSEAKPGPAKDDYLSRVDQELKRYE
jgi:cytochrome c-type biogenesis protein CcmH